MFNQSKHNRQSIRLHGYDYSQPGFYFITMVVQDRKCLFGRIINGKMQLNEYGEIADTCWQKIPQIRTNVSLDAHIIMPNHVHGILVLKNIPKPNVVVRATDPSVRATESVAPTTTSTTIKTDDTNIAKKSVAPTVGSIPLSQPKGPKRGSIGAIIGQYKSVVTKRINAIRQTSGISVWHRDYYDHIGRNKKEIFPLRQYIQSNPLRWNVDKENPAIKSPRYVAMPNPQKNNYL